MRLALVVLLPLLMALAPASAETVVRKGTTTTLTAIDNSNFTYKWEIYAGTNLSLAITTEGNCPVTSAKFIGGNTGASVKVIWLQPGYYFYKVTVRDALGCARNFKIGILKVIPLVIEAVITGVTVSGACETVVLDASKSVGNDLEYKWSSIDPGGVLSQTSGVNTEFQLSPSFTGSLPANFGVQLQVSDKKGNTHSETIAIKVDIRPVADINSTGKLEKDGSLIVDGSVSTGTSLNFRWSTSGGKILGPTNEPVAKLNSAGIYTLEITDIHGCISKKSFNFPVDIHQIIARNDHARIDWAQDTTIFVLDNDLSTLKLMPGSVHVTELPEWGGVKVNNNGSITYKPVGRRTGQVRFVYEVCDEVSLCASASVIIDIYDSNITVPEGFTPNGDGLNELLVFKGLIENYPKSQLYVFTRSGRVVYQNLDYKNDWNGSTLNSSVTNLELVPTSTYYYVLKLGGTNRSLKGFIYIGY